MPDPSLNINISARSDVAPIKNVSNALKDVSAQTTAATQASKLNTAGTEGNRRAMAALQMALRGDVQGLSQLAQSYQQSTGAASTFLSVVGKLSVAVASFMAGWKAGIKVQEWLWKHLVDSVQSLGPVLVRTKADFDKLNQVKLSALEQSVKAVEDSLTSAIAKTDQLLARQDKLAFAESEAEQALIETDLPPGPERDALIRNRKDKAKEAQLLRQTTTLDQQRQSTLQAISGIATQRGAAQSEISAAQANYDAAKARIQAGQAKGRAYPAMGPIASEAAHRLASAQSAFSGTTTRLSAREEALRQQLADTDAELDATKASLDALRYRRQPTPTTRGALLSNIPLQSSNLLGQISRAGAISSASSALQSAAAGQAEQALSPSAAQSAAEQFLLNAPVADPGPAPRMSGLSSPARRRAQAQAMSQWQSRSASSQSQHSAIQASLDKVRSGDQVEISRLCRLIEQLGDIHQSGLRAAGKSASDAHRKADQTSSQVRNSRS